MPNKPLQGFRGQRGGAPVTDKKNSVWMASTLPGNPSLACLIFYTISAIKGAKSQPSA